MIQFLTTHPLLALIALAAIFLLCMGVVAKILRFVLIVALACVGYAVYRHTFGP